MIRIAALIAMVASPVTAQQVTEDDNLMGLQAIAIALTEQEEARWINTTTTNSGKVEVHGQIDGGPSGCVGFTNHLVVQNQLPAQSEYMVACRGGGNSNTWIVNRSWVISSVERGNQGNCRTRFMDTKLPRGRVQSTATICKTATRGWLVEE